MTAKSRPAAHDSTSAGETKGRDVAVDTTNAEEAEKPVPVIDLDAEIDSSATELEAGDERLAASEQQAQEYYERLLRLTAEFDNYKKRMAREKTDFMRYANENLVKDLLESVDNLERALSHEAENGSEGLAEGLRLTLKMLLETLARHGVKPVEAIGQPFDPNFHEAVSQTGVDHVDNNHVIEEYQRGYLLHDRLLRPAMVLVCRK